jgi:sterol 3beta-glucosyltransferase
MHYGIIAIGSRGDVQPFVALSVGLIRRGHRVTLLAHENFKSFVEGFSIDFYPLTGSAEEMIHDPKGLRLLQSGNTLKLLRYIHERGLAVQDRVNRDLWEGCQPADVLVTSVLGVPWVSCIAEKTGKRWAIIQLSFPTTPTRAFPFAGMDVVNFPVYNLLTYRLIRSFYWRQIKAAVNEFRRSIGLPQLKHSIFDKAASDHILTLYAVSPVLLPRPADWDPDTQVTDFLSLPSPPVDGTAATAKDLMDWLDDGERPIYIGFGSMPIPDPALFMRVLQELLARTPHRYIFCQGWSQLADYPTDSRLYVVPTADHAWLLPQCRAAVIHGGVGTLAATLQAGVPPVIVSIFGDQNWWGKRIERMQLGRHLSFKRLSADKLIAAIDSVLSPAVRQNLETVAFQLQGEDGLKATIEKMERYFL